MGKIVAAFGRIRAGWAKLGPGVTRLPPHEGRSRPNSHRFRPISSTFGSEFGRLRARWAKVGPGLTSVHMRGDLGRIAPPTSTRTISTHHWPVFCCPLSARCCPLSARVGPLSDPSLRQMWPATAAIWHRWTGRIARIGASRAEGNLEGHVVEEYLHHSCDDPTAGTETRGKKPWDDAVKQNSRRRSRLLRRASGRGAPLRPFRRRGRCVATMPPEYGAARTCDASPTQDHPQSKVF